MKPHRRVINGLAWLLVVLGVFTNASNAAAERSLAVPSPAEASRLIAQARAKAKLDNATTPVVRYNTGGHSTFDGWIETCPDQLAKLPAGTTSYDKCVYISGRIVESYRVNDNRPRLLQRWLYDAQGRPVLSIEFDWRGREIGMTVAEYDQRSRLSQLLFVYHGPELDAPVVSGLHRFAYLIFPGQDEMTVKESYDGKGELQGVTIWRGNDVWIGGPDGDLRLVNHGSRESWIREPERHGLAPFYPLDQPGKSQ